MPIGPSVISPGPVVLKVRIQTPVWLRVDRVQILIKLKSQS